MSGGGFYSGKGKGGAQGGGGGGKASASPAKPGDTLPGSLVRKLKALKYPEMDAVSVNGQTFCKIVLWLEEEKIRLYEKPDRKVLRDFNRTWYEHVSDYCKELGIDSEGLDERNTAVKLKVLNGLTNLAIHDIYRDQAEANELTVAPPPKGFLKSGDQPPQKLQELVGPLNTLLETFSLPTLPDSPPDTDTLAAVQCIHTRLCPPKATKTEDGAKLDLNTLPVGIDIADPEVKRAACVLRLLHGNELQLLQVHINNVINDLQQLTADPKTDSRLGRVGR
jgi:RLL motif-containing protein 1|eukprot:TRINITY_DN56530_c0_g1_i1.p1 TRINITY_DN56530_c0_g1~~TRINITY_DN56530_c0_g1_i1.p1  ORF type:complete len:279 (+),score=53.21 TRINITY_DN56530_c0_g1_i1:107-943(+)